MATHAVHERPWPITRDKEVTRLFRQAQRGDEGALDALLARVRPWLVRYLTHESGTDDANDLAQLGLVHITRAVERGLQEPAIYLLKLAANLRRAARRRQRRDAWRSDRIALGYRITPPVQHDVVVEQRELIAAVRQLVARLSPRLRPVVLGVLEGLSPSEIAAQLSVRPGAIRRRLQRARALLVQELAPYLDVLAESQAAPPKQAGSVDLPPQT